MSAIATDATDSQEKDPTRLKFNSNELNGHMMMEMVDSGETHNFMKDSIAKILGLKLEESPNAIKVVNL